jgi:lipid A 3-O-deacylase
VKKAVLISLASTMFCLVHSASHAADPEDAWQGAAFVWENDYFGRDRIHTDRWYTNGMHYAWSYRRGQAIAAPFRWVREFGREYLGIESDTRGGEPTAAGFIGHNIYTPKDIEVTTQQIHDRPYAGQLTFGIGSFAYRGDWHKALELRIGVVGPAALGGEVQRTFHKIIKDDPPLGWHLQVRPRPVIQASLMATKRFRDLPVLPAWAALHWHGRATVGSIKNVLATGATLVAGERDRVFGAPDEGDFFAVDFNQRANYFPRDSFMRRVTFFAQVQAAAVGSNYLIEGKTYGPRPQIELKHGTWMAAIGASIRLSNAWRLDYRVKRRSSEFLSAFPGSNDKMHSYGEVRLSKDFHISSGPEEMQLR